MQSTPPPTLPFNEENAPVVLMVSKRKCAKHTKLLNKTAQDNTKAMNAAIEQKRGEYRSSIKDLAFKYNRLVSCQDGTEEC